MKVRILEVVVEVIYSPLDDILNSGTKAVLHAPREASEEAARKVSKIILKHVSQNCRATVLVAYKDRSAGERLIIEGTDP